MRLSTQEHVVIEVNRIGQQQRMHARMDADDAAL